MGTACYCNNNKNRRNRHESNVKENNKNPPTDDNNKNRPTDDNNKTPPTDDNNNEESENKESISYLLNSFKPYYSVNIERNTIIFHILLFADKSSIKEVSIKEMKDYYYIYIKGYKNNAYKHFYNIHYGNFFIETEISKNELTLENKKYEISKDNNRYIIVTIN